MLTIESSLTLAQVGAAVYSVPGLLVEAGLERPVARVTVRQRGMYVDVLPVGAFVISLVIEQQIRSAVTAAESGTELMTAPAQAAARPKRKATQPVGQEASAPA